MPMPGDGSYGQEAWRVLALLSTPTPALSLLLGLPPCSQPGGQGSWQERMRAWASREVGVTHRSALYYLSKAA